MAETYLEHVGKLEEGLGPFAFHSERITEFTDGTDAIAAFEEQWNSAEGGARLSGRTPLTLERDRILYSDELRRQADKHHLLFYKSQRVSRDYTTHTLRVAHVARSAGARLRLNTALAEAIALGCKVGGVPFLHVAKKSVDEWVRGKLASIDASQQPRVDSRARTRDTQRSLLDVTEEGALILPSWLQQVQSPHVRDEIKKYLPWAAGNPNEPSYTSGQQSYWLLSTNPYVLTAKAHYTRQTMYGVWRHSLGQPGDLRNFQHDITLLGSASPTTLSLSQEDLTHEAVLVRYADDITWTIENLNEANRAAALFEDRRNAVYDSLALTLASEGVPDALTLALQPVGDTGRLYTYFIDDLVRTSSDLMEAGLPSSISETEPLVALSVTAGRMLRLMKGFLDNNVFADDRIRLRNNTLAVLSTTILDLLYESQAEALVDLMRRRSRLEGWSREALQAAEDYANAPVHRVQACVDALSQMSDREVYDFIGLENL